METIEMTAETVEEAIAAGMRELGVDSPAQVMVEVLQEPDRGIMGEGARPAVVRLVFMGSRGGAEATPITGYAPQTTSSEATVISSHSYDEEEDDDDDYGDEDFAAGDALDESAEEDARVGKEVLLEILERMRFDVEVNVSQARATRPGEQTHWVLNIEGDKVSRLIGKRGDTLSSLQYITRLIVSRKLQRRANLIVDVDGYKAKRSENLRRLANRMADQAVRQGRAITLEPMPPNERRIIHLTLRQRDDVTTHSVGEGDGRKVTIAPTN
jgi:spoIIIJ-associated protein